MAKQNKKPKGILEAMGTIAGDLQRRTQDEVVEQALAEAKTEQMVENLEQTNNRTKETTPSSMNAPLKKEKLETPVSSIDPPLVIPPSIPESPPQGKTNPKTIDVIDVDLQRLKDYVQGEEYSINWVRLHLSNLGRIPNVIPVMTLWDIPTWKDIPEDVYNVVMTDGYLENIWPSLRMIMGSSRDNLYWTAGVLTTMALFDAIRMLATCGEK